MNKAVTTTKHVIISGVVQGVFFRRYTKEHADQLGLSGWVRNLDDGSVEAVFQGPSEAVAKMLNWCWQGPSSARVDSVQEVKPAEDRTYSRFIVR